MKLKSTLFLIVFIFFSSFAQANNLPKELYKENERILQETVILETPETKKEAKPEDKKEGCPFFVASNFGLSYFTLLFGPGFHPDAFTYNPNHLGKPSSNGVYTSNNLSIKYKITNDLNFDLSLRFIVFFNNSKKLARYNFFRWETPRIGVSGLLLKGKNWALRGAVNTESPCFLPVPLTGYTSKNRTALFTPGLFASFEYAEKGSPWSIFSLLEPRFYFYEDPHKDAPEVFAAGGIPENKPELALTLRPTVSYAIDEKIKITVGANIDYRKQVISSWNPFNASLISNGRSPAWRLQATAINAGITYSFNKQLTIYPFISTFPIAAQRADAKTGVQTPILKATFFGMWLRGTIF